MSMVVMVQPLLLIGVPPDAIECYLPVAVRNDAYLCNDIVRLIATLLISGKLIMSKYVAESITMIEGRFGQHVSHCSFFSSVCS